MTGKGWRKCPQCNRPPTLEYKRQATRNRVLSCCAQYAKGATGEANLELVFSAAASLFTLDELYRMDTGLTRDKIRKLVEGQRLCL